MPDKMCISFLLIPIGPFTERPAVSMAFQIRNNTEAHRFELETEGKTAFTAYRLFDGGIEFRHTEVPPELEGRGIGSALAKHVLDYAKANHLETIVSCPFIKKWQQRHPA
jgi:predicted GNAT family acetyltransferase